MVEIRASATSTRLRRYTGRRATVASGMRLRARSTIAGQRTALVRGFTKYRARPYAGRRARRREPLTTHAALRSRRPRHPGGARLRALHARAVAGAPPPPRARLDRGALPVRAGLAGAARRGRPQVGR